MTDIITFPGGDVDLSAFRRDSRPTRTTVGGEQRDLGTLEEARVLRAACESEALLWEHRLIAARLRRRARLARAKGVVALTDSSADATDFAHPAWWRGHEHGVRGAVANQELQAVVEEIARLRELAALRRLPEGLRLPGHRVREHGSPHRGGLVSDEEMEGPDARR